MPIRQDKIYDRVNELYADPDAIHHWETQEVLLDDDIVYMEKGKVVNESFRVTMPDGVQKTKLESVYPVSNYEHEEHENEKKRFLILPTPPILELILTDMQTKLAYEPHSEVDGFGEKTELSIISRFLDSVSYVSGSVSVTQRSQNVTVDFGPTSAGIGVGSVTVGDTTTTTPTPTPTPGSKSYTNSFSSPSPSPSPSDGGGGGGARRWILIPTSTI